MSTFLSTAMVRILTMEGQLLNEQLGGWTVKGGTYRVAWGYAKERNSHVHVEGIFGNWIVTPDGILDIYNPE